MFTGVQNRARERAMYFFSFFFLFSFSFRLAASRTEFAILLTAPRILLLSFFLVFRRYITDIHRFLRILSLLVRIHPRENGTDLPFEFFLNREKERASEREREKERGTVVYEYKFIKNHGVTKIFLFLRFFGVSLNV